jgi:hypothetical protein
MQHDLSIANQGFPSFRSDLNDALQALGTNSSGATAPATTYANQLWYDTANNILKIRNEDNDAWISIGTLDQSADTLTAIGGKTLPSGTIVGTSDSQAFTNKTFTDGTTIEGLTVGRGAGAVSTNTAVGASALNANTTGLGNTALGSSASALNTTGSLNVALGRFAMYSNTTGSQNIAIGYETFFANTTGGNNTAVGQQALTSNTTASNNTAVGYGGLQYNITGTGNSALGYRAGWGITSNYNTAIGVDSMSYVSGGVGQVSGANNTALGYQTFYNLSSGSNNTAVGYQALYLSTTGAMNTAIGGLCMESNTTGNYNTAIGRQSLGSNTTGAYNIAIGYQAGISSSTGLYNSFVGSASGINSTGTNNTFMGAEAGYYMSSGSKNTILGMFTGNQGGVDIRTASNRIVISDGDGNPRLHCNNDGDWTMASGLSTGAAISIPQTVYRATSSTGVGYMGYIGTATAFQISFNSTTAGVQLGSGATSWASFSDERLKNVTGTYTNALHDIAQIQPVKFTWKSDAENKPQVGVIAQSVQTVVPEAVEALTMEMDSPDEYLTVRYTELIPLMIASIQELKAEVDSLKAQLNNGV